MQHAPFVKLKRNNPKSMAGRLFPEKDAEAMPWDRLCVDLIGPYNIKSNVKGVKIPPLKCITMIDRATGGWLLRDQTIATMIRNQ
jgi:hypothetical protein